MGKILGHLEPKQVWQHFEEICNYPRPSKHEEKAVAFLLKWAENNNFAAKRDSTGNIVISKKATPGMENRKPIVIQGHIDMVCEKNSDVSFDFFNDPIQPWIDGDWVKAKGTTLGADNGIGVAMGMAIMTSPDIAHPDIELLCTLDEETGLTGAMTLADDLIKGEILINLDSEEDNAFTIGCAGGQNTVINFEYQPVPITYDDYIPYEIAIKGLRGGHSGIEIHDGRANAIKMLNRALWNMNKLFDIKLASINGGNKHNAIPREAFATLLVPASKEYDFLNFAKEYENTIKKEYQTKEPALVFAYFKADSIDKVFPKEFQIRLLNALYAAPHGVYRMSPDIQGLVQTSNNLAIIETRDNEVFVLTSERSSVESEKKVISETIRSCFELAGASVKHSDGYPAWQPNINSPILKQAESIYNELFGHKPEIVAIHAGLECGLIGEKYPNMDMISFGPNLKDVHSPDERLQISSVQKCWKLLVELIENTPLKQ